MDRHSTQTDKYALLDRAIAFGIKCHQDAGKMYGDKPYSYHLNLVFTYAKKYMHLTKPSEFFEIRLLSACYTHDVIEDCGVTYNDVKQATDHIIAELSFALCTEKGRTRKERHSIKYYEDMKKTEGAVFLKLCDRLANVWHSAMTQDSKLDMYRKEWPRFRACLDNFDPNYAEMFEELEFMLFQEYGIIVQKYLFTTPMFPRPAKD